MSNEEIAGSLYLLDGPESKEEAVAGLASATLKHALLKLNPSPFLFLMTDEDYFEFSLLDIVAVLDGEQLPYDIEPDHISPASKFIFQLILQVEGVDSRLWLAGEDEDGKEYWLYHIQNAINLCRQPYSGSGSGNGSDEHKMDSSWEIDESNIRVEKKVGAGQFGDVFLGQLWGKEVAIKRMQDLSEDSLKSVQMEIGMLSQLRHPNIVLYIGACSKPPTVQIVTEWCAHGSLEDILFNPDQHFNTQALIRSALEIAQGMSYLHSRRVMHRDLKSANVFVDKHLVMKVGDFGLSHAMKNEIADIAGTPMFMAPECWSGEYDERVDIWAFGMMLIEMITRDQPFPCVSSEEVQQLVLAKKLPHIPDWVPESVKEVILNCWHFDPTKRWSFETIIEKLKMFRTWDTEKFYSEVDFNRLRYFLGSHEERLLLWAVSEIAAIEAGFALGSDSSSSSSSSVGGKSGGFRGISIYNTSNNDLVGFISRLTHLLGHSSLKVQLGAAKALANFFTHLSGELHQHSSEAGLSQGRSRGQPREPKMGIEQCRLAAANDNQGISMLISLLVKARQDRHDKRQDKRLVGLKPALTAGQLKGMYTTSMARMDLDPDAALLREFEREALRLLSQLLGPKLAIEGLDKEELTYLRKFIASENSTLKRQMRAVQTQMGNNQALLADICLLEVKAEEKKSPRMTNTTTNNLKPVISDDLAIGSRRFNKAMAEGRTRSLQPDALSTPVNAATPLSPKTSSGPSSPTSPKNAAGTPPNLLKQPSQTRATGISAPQAPLLHHAVQPVPPAKPAKPPKATKDS